MIKKIFIFYLTGALLLISVGNAWSQSLEKIDTAIISKIKSEGLHRSQVMDILSMLTDVHGPRLTNSPGYKTAADYVKNSLELWGVQNVHFDVWDEDFGRGWQLKKFSLQSVAPVYASVIAYPKAWSPGVKGTIHADVVYLDIKKEEDINQYKGKLKGKIVLFSLPTTLKPSFKPDATRYNDSTLLQMSNADVSESLVARKYQAPIEPQRLAYLKWELCKNEGVVAVLESSIRLEDGTLMVAGATVPYPAETAVKKRLPSYDAKAPKILPQIVVAIEHYNRMVRQIKKGKTVTLTLMMEVEFSPSAPGYNVIGDIPGTDLKDEVVMMGAHLDSWHSGTGTTDNGVGSAVMMEAMRIIKTLGVQPRRTIRMGLWGGEEQGLLGSKSYVKRTLGERIDKSFPYDSLTLKPAAEKFSVYFNMDNGTGKFRGVFMQGNENVRSIFRAWLKPFEKMGASTLSLRNTGSTDHIPFDAIGLPAFQFIQDPIEYGTRTWHASMDVYDKASEPDLKQNAVMMAAFAWSAANRDELIPRR